MHPWEELVERKLQRAGRRWLRMIYWEGGGAGRRCQRGLRTVAEEEALPLGMAMGVGRSGGTCTGRQIQLIGLWTEASLPRRGLAPGRQQTLPR